MADQPQSPEPPHPSHELIEEHLETVRVRRAPKYGVFLLLGGALGLFAAMILTFAFDGTQSESPNTGMIYTQGQVFGFLALICVPAGVALLGLLALLLDRTVGRRTRPLHVEREAVQVVD